MPPKLEQIQKQNEGMYNNLVKNGVEITRPTPPDTTDEAQLVAFYQQEQQELRNALVEFRKNQPKPNPKLPPKPKAPKNPPAKKENKPKPKDDEDEVPVEKKPNYPTISNMEELKRAFFNDETETFLQKVKEQPFLFFYAKYKYESDMDGKADFIARNFVKGFISNLDEHRKYLFNCFRCFASENNTYTYPSMWIVNTTTPLTTLLGDYSEDFEFMEVDSNNVDSFLQEFQPTKSETNLLDEKYLH